MAAKATRKRRWVEDGGDFYTGSQAIREYKDGADRHRGRGGDIVWKVRPYRYQARVWIPCGRSDRLRRKTFPVRARDTTEGRAVNAAKRWVERVLDAAK